MIITRVVSRLMTWECYLEIKTKLLIKPLSYNPLFCFIQEACFSFMQGTYLYFFTLYIHLDLMIFMPEGGVTKTQVLFHMSVSNSFCIDFFQAS